MLLLGVCAGVGEACRADLNQVLICKVINGLLLRRQGCAPPASESSRIIYILCHYLNSTITPRVGLSSALIYIASGGSRVESLLLFLKVADPWHIRRDGSL